MAIVIGYRSIVGALTPLYPLKGTITAIAIVEVVVL
jgi:hypothetical protein